MNVEFKKSFLKDLKKIKDHRLKEAVHESILTVEGANSIDDVKNLKKLKGYQVHYRIRIGDYRIGIKLEEETVNFVVFLHRKDIYKGFP